MLLFVPQILFRLPLVFESKSEKETSSLLTVFNVPPSQRKTSFQRLCVYIRYCALRSAENTDCGCRPDSSIRLLSENRLRCYISAPTISKVSAVSTSHQSLRTLFCLQCRDFKEDIQISEALGCTLSALLRRATSSDVNIQVRFRLCNLVLSSHSTPRFLT